ncbi:MAG: hypothetical protein EU516_00300 [Promethearchaeota archaeon]|nr:MAG: hypothetical protein EU516_00300 [Candidatus Lokiarchaeota archaeon]
MLTKFKNFFQTLWKNKILGYSWIVTNLLIIFYMIVYLILGPSENLPLPGEPLDLAGFSFLLLISYSFFLLFLFIISWSETIYKKIFKKNVYIKLLGLNLVFFLIAFIVPTIIFFGLYVVAYFLWYIINAIIFIFLLKDVSSFLTLRLVKNKKTHFLFYFLFWIIGIAVFGYTFITVPWMDFDLYQQMPLLIFPTLIIILPILGLILKPRNDNRAPITLFSLLIAAYVFYIWYRYLNWDNQIEIITISDALIDIVMITYIFYSLFKNANKISQRLKEKVSFEQILLLFIWARISSLIIQLTVSEYTFLGVSASEGSYLISMFLLIIFGLITGTIWIRQGISQKEKIN